MVTEKKMIKKSAKLALVGLLVVSFNSQSANTSGVHGPVVDANDRSMQYRFAFEPGEDGASDRTAHRFHYQHSLNESFRARIITQFRDQGDDLEYDYLRAELLWHFKPRETGIWDSGVRFDIRTRKGSRPELFSVNWTNQWNLSPKWRLRGILIGGWEFGGTAEGGTLLDARSSLTYKMDNGHRIGIESFSEFGKISDMGSFNEQEHQIGPVLSGKVAGFSYQLGYLAGASDAASKHDVRFWLGKSF